MLKEFDGKRSPEERKVRGHSLMPGQRKAQVNPELLVSSVFETPLENRDNVVRMFDDEGLLATREVGVKRFYFEKLSFFYALRSLSWSVLITYSVMLYLAIVFLFALVYFSWSVACGARNEGSTFMGALYFTVVSLAANGGYLGEPKNSMTQPNHICFSGRTVIVMILSYSNIIFVGLVAALVVGKAEYAGKLGQRIVFSDFCSLTVVPARQDRSWRLTFRMANSIGQKPIAHGRLRLFIITSEPLKDYRRRRKEMQKNYYGRLLSQRHKHIGNRSSADLLTEAIQSQKIYGTGEIINAPAGGSNNNKQQQQTMELNLSMAGAPLSALLLKAKSKQTQRGKNPSRGRRKRRDIDPNDVPSHAPRHRESHTTLVEVSSAALPIETPSYDEDTETARAVFSLPVPGQTPPAVPADVGSDSADHSSSSHDSVKTISSGGSRHASQAKEEEINEFERVRISVEEVRWSCSEERHLDMRAGHLSLWFPVNIHHMIDRQSPLYRFVEQRQNSDGISVGSPARPEPSLTSAQKMKGAGRGFQLVATFDAVELESGATITAKRTYTVNDIVPHYRFSNKMVHMRPGSNEVELDFHYFNEMLPVTAVESSTSDSEPTYA